MPVGSSDEPKPSDFSARESVTFVLLPVSVTTANGRPVTGLEREDFRLYDSGRQQEIEFFATEEDSPMTLAFVLDVSGSMALNGRLDSAKKTIRAIVERLSPQDRMGLICFADDQVAWVTPFTEDRELFLRRLDVQEGYGPTALYDALAKSPALVGEAASGRRSMVLLTDGLDNASALPVMDAIWLARRAHVPIYVLDFVASDPQRMLSRDEANIEVLGAFARETGGAVWPVREADQLEAAVAAIQDDLRFQYLLGFSASGSETKFHPLKVETRRRDHRIRARSGYYPGP